MPESTAILSVPPGLMPRSSQPRHNGYPPSTTLRSPPQSSLPSFYSPRPTAAASRAIPDFDLNNHSSSSSSHAPSAVPPYLLQQAQQNDDPLPLDGGRFLTPGLDHHHVPPSLVSPAFTPPATPGTGTPALQREAASVPVDSSDEVNGGVGSLKPKLLEKLPEVRCIVRARIPTTTGTEIFLHLYQNNIDNKEHLAIVFGPHIRSRSLDAPRPGETEMDRMIRGAYTGRLYPGRTTSHLPIPATPTPPTPPSGPPLVRIHSECYTGETTWSSRCDCGEQLDEAARLISLPPTPHGAIIYLRQEGRGIGLLEKLKAYNLQDLGSDTVEANLLLRHPADARSYGLATAMLVDLGLGGERGVRLLTNNPEKVRAVEGPGREVVVRERVAMVPLAWRTGGERGVQSAEVGGYLRAKVRVAIRSRARHVHQANGSGW
ncbi:GTP cyclohydrolase II [Glutinoglossum americanum]|uniref:GTP cyclohydrolase II n=1 Tax=Glutinoglossum americanum TaxID=1670608 RepID=A0A9P8I3P6_9PEZI|nr:GTP cyclohydrolase II [Glutinoglossum americanum]